MAIIKGERVRKELGPRQESAVEKESQLAFMSSGIKFRKKALENMGLKEGDHIWYFIDDETNQVYLAKVAEDQPDRSKISTTNTFVNKGLTEHLFAIANVEFEGFQTKDQLIFNVAETALEGGYHELTFNRVKTGKEVEAEEKAEQESAEAQNEELKKEETSNKGSKKSTTKVEDNEEF